MSANGTALSEMRPAFHLLNHAHPLFPVPFFQHCIWQVVVGRLRVNKKNYEDCYIPGKPRFQRDINVPSMAARNRAFDRDIVAVELLPRYLWRIMDKEAAVRGT